MQERKPKLRIYTMTGLIGCKCDTCGWAATTPYVNGERTDQTVQRVFRIHVCSPLEDEPALTPASAAAMEVGATA